MTVKQRELSGAMFVLCVLITLLITSSDATAYNRARDVKLLRQDKRSTFVFLFDGSPAYSLEEMDRHQIVLTFEDTVETPLLRERIAQMNDSVSLAQETGPPVKLRI